MPSAARARSPKFTQTTAVLAMCAVLIVVFSVSLKGFMTVGNLFALARNISILGILALGMAITIIGAASTFRMSPIARCWSPAVAIILIIGRRDPRSR